MTERRNGEGSTGDQAMAETIGAGSPEDVGQSVGESSRLAAEATVGRTGERPAKSRFRPSTPTILQIKTS